MSKLKIFLVLLMCSACFAIPFKVETVKEGSGDSIRAGQLRVSGQCKDYG